MVILIGAQCFPKSANVIYITLWLEFSNLSIHNFNIPKSTSNDFLNTKFYVINVNEQMTLLGISLLKKTKKTS